MICVQKGINKVFFLLLLVLFFQAIASPVRAQQSGNAATLDGTVLNEKGEPLHLVNIRIKGTTKGDVTNQKGRFQMQVADSDSVTIIASMVGYKSASKVVSLSAEETKEISLKISRSRESLEETAITGDAFTTGNVEGVTLSPTEVVTTSGAAADIF